MQQTTSYRRFDKYISNIEKLPALKKAMVKAAANYESADQAGIEMDSVLYLVAIAPALVAYVNWVLMDAEKNQKNRLYFLSRDGYQMYLIAKRIVELKEMDIECRYLHVSRYSMRIPGYHLDLNAAIDSICVGGIDVTAKKILKRGALTESECEAVLTELGLQESQNNILNYSQVMQLKEKLVSSDLLKQYVEAHSKERYEAAIGYLKQEGLCRDDKYAIVDSGWIGTLQCSIEKLVQSVSPELHVQGYYYGMYEVPKGTSFEQFKSYYFSGTRGSRRKSKFSNSLFETIVSSTEGMTVGYEWSEGEYRHIENDEKNPNAMQMQRNISMLEAFLKNLQNAYLKEILSKKLERIAEKNIKLFMASPTPLEVKAYGYNRFSDDVIDGNFKEVAANLSWEQIKNQRLLRKLLIIKGIRKQTIYESAWIEGSVMRATIAEEQMPEIKALREYQHIRLYKRIIFIKKQIQTRGYT